VKTRLTKIDIAGEIHPKLLSVLREVYGTRVKLTDDSKDEFVEAEDTSWFASMRARLTPGKTMKLYRELRKMTQEELGQKLGAISRQNISHMERGIRPISKKTAKLLAALFKVPVDRFI
jgi:DNA-binding XRE family transcriptional regulator